MEDTLAERVILIVCCVAFGVLLRDVAQDYRDVKPKKKQAQMDPAPIWSQRCERQGKTIIAKQADGGRWVIHCLPAGRQPMRAEF